jgi:hypothetical protein
LANRASQDQAASGDRRLIAGTPLTVSLASCSRRLWRVPLGRRSAARKNKSRLFFGVIVDATDDLRANRGMLLLVALFAASLTLAFIRNSAPLEGGAATAGRPFVALPLPPERNPNTCHASSHVILGDSSR